MDHHTIAMHTKLSQHHATGARSSDEEQTPSKPCNGGTHMPTEEQESHIGIGQKPAKRLGGEVDLAKSMIPSHFKSNSVNAADELTNSTTMTNIPNEHCRQAKQLQAIQARLFTLSDNDKMHKKQIADYESRLQYLQGKVIILLDSMNDRAQRFEERLHKIQETYCEMVAEREGELVEKDEDIARLRSELEEAKRLARGG